MDKYKLVVSKMSLEVQKLVIKTKEDLELASTKREEIKKQIKSIEAEKDKVLAPLKEAMKAEKARWIPIENRLEGMLEILNRGMIKYMTEQRAIEQAKEAKILADGRTKTETKIDKLATIEKVENKVGNTSFVEHQCFELEDITKVPTEYLLINEVAIRKAMKEGTKLAGIRYWTESRPRTSN